MSSGASEVHKTTTGEDDDSLAVGEDEAINLILDVLDLDTGVVLETLHIDLVVEMTNVAYNSIVLHLGHIGGHDDLEVSSGSDENISGADNR